MVVPITFPEQPHAEEKTMLEGSAISSLLTQAQTLLYA